MAKESGEFNDWELLSLKSSNSVSNLSDLETEPHSIIQTDYFSLENSLIVTGGSSDQGSVCSDNPSWVDPESASRFVEGGRQEVWPDSGSDRSEDCGFEDTEAKREVGFVGNEIFLMGFEGIGEVEAKGEVGFVGNGKSFVGFEGIGEIESKRELGFVGNEKYVMGFEGIGEIESRREVGFVENKKSFVGIEEIGEHNLEIGPNSVVAEEIFSPDSVSKTESDAGMEVAKPGGEGEKRGGVVWWRVPLELLKFCAFRVSPVWSFSMAAAVMGVVILTRRLYKLKKKSQALKLKVTMDDKKVSQFMSRAARLNEAFSVVKRVPLIRPAMPTTGGLTLTQWPVMSLR